MRREDYNFERQLDVILSAVKSLGIHAEKSGRNDITADGRKFSGNAFYFTKSSAYHHGTILVSSDLGKLSRYLQVSKEKIAGKGVASVQSRVVNLTELNPFCYGGCGCQLFSCGIQRYLWISARNQRRSEDIDNEAVQKLRENMLLGMALWTDSQVRYNHGNTVSWGGIEIGLNPKRKGGVLEGLLDAMDEARSSACS